MGVVDIDHLKDSEYDLGELHTITHPDDVGAAPGVPEGDYTFIKLTNPQRDLGDYNSNRYE